MELQTIHGIMITGKNIARMDLAILAAENFFEQYYDPNRLKLIIINTSSFRIKDCVINNNILEYYVEQNDLTLGDLRNIALSKLKDNDVWIQWDDDDIKHPNYLSNQYAILKNEFADIVVLSGQLRYSTKKDSIWYVSDGRIDGSIMTYYDSRFKYKSEKTGEDTYFIDELIAAGKTIKYCDTIMLYLRIINDHNTWDENHFGLEHVPFGALIVPNSRIDEHYDRMIKILKFYNNKIEKYLNCV